MKRPPLRKDFFKKSANVVGILKSGSVAEKVMFHVVLVHAFVAAAFAKLALIEGHGKGREEEVLQDGGSRCRR